VLLLPEVFLLLELDEFELDELELELGGEVEFGVE